MLTADNDFIKTSIERHYVEVIKRALEDMYGLPFTVIIEVDMTPRAPMPSRSSRTRQPGRAVHRISIPAGAQDPSQFRQPYEAAPRTLTTSRDPLRALPPLRLRCRRQIRSRGRRTSRTPTRRPRPRTRKPGRNGKVTAGPQLATRPRSRSPHNPTSTAARPNSCKTPRPMRNAGSSGFDFGGALSGFARSPRPIDRRKPDEPTAHFRKRR